MKRPPPLKFTFCRTELWFFSPLSMYVAASIPTLVFRDSFKTIALVFGGRKRFSLYHVAVRTVLRCEARCRAFETVSFLCMFAFLYHWFIGSLRQSGPRAECSLWAHIKRSITEVICLLYSATLYRSSACLQIR